MKKLNTALDELLALVQDIHTRLDACEKAMTEALFHKEEKVS